MGRSVWISVQTKFAVRWQDFGVLFGDCPMELCVSYSDVGCHYWLMKKVTLAYGRVEYSQTGRDI